MKHLKLILCFLILLLLESTLLAQPYIYFSKVIDSTDSNPMNWRISINRFNLKNNLEEPFLYDVDFISYTWDRTQTWLILDRLYWYSHIYNCLDTLNNFDLPAEIGGGVFPVLYSKEKNTLYVTRVFEDKLKLFEFNVNTKNLTQSFEEFPQIIHNNKEGMFFSSSEEKIYVPVLDTNYSGMGKLLIYSTMSKHIMSLRDLSVYGYPNADGYILYKGKDGVAVILSYIHNITKDSYFRVYNFDSDFGSNFIKYQGFADPYFTNKGKHLILANIYDSLNAYSGKIDIYDVSSGERIKNIILPPGGEIYTFDNYPNDIYYVKNIDTQPEIYNLTKFRLNTITPGLSLPYTSGLVITVKGGLFTSSSQAYFNNQQRTTTYLTDTTLSVQLNAGDLSTVGNYPIWISNYGSNSDTLTYSVVSSLPQPITPLVECVKNNGGGSYTARFGYRNDNTKSVFVPVGTNNKFSPTPENRGQPTIFLPGRNYQVFSVNFDGKNLVWNIFSKKVTASKNSTPCP